MQKLYLEALIVRQGEAERKMLEEEKNMPERGVKRGRGGKQKGDEGEEDGNEETKGDEELQQLSQLSTKDLLKFITFGAQKILTMDGTVCQTGCQELIVSGYYQFGHRTLDHSFRRT